MPQPPAAGYGFWRGQSGSKLPHSKIAFRRDCGVAPCNLGVRWLATALAAPNRRERPSHPFSQATVLGAAKAAASCRTPKSLLGETAASLCAILECGGLPPTPRRRTFGSAPVGNACYSAAFSSIASDSSRGALRCTSQLG